MDHGDDRRPASLAYHGYIFLVGTALVSFFHPCLLRPGGGHVYRNVHARLETIMTRDSGRIEARFAALKAKKQSGLITFVTAGDPDMDTCAKILAGLAKAGVDIVELGMPFSDPMADGPAIQ